jgi:hypothetical protein
MRQEDAKREIIKKWTALPKSERQTDDQAAQFAMKMKDKYQFKSSGDPYQHIKAWLQKYLSLTRGLD